MEVLLESFRKGTSKKCGREFETGDSTTSEETRPRSESLSPKIPKKKGQFEMTPANFEFHKLLPGTVEIKTISEERQQFLKSFITDVLFKMGYIDKNNVLLKGTANDFGWVFEEIPGKPNPELVAIRFMDNHKWRTIWAGRV